MTERPEDREYDLRVREIALREAVQRANGVNGAFDTLACAKRYEQYLRGVSR